MGHIKAKTGQKLNIEAGMPPNGIEVLDIGLAESIGMDKHKFQQLKNKWDAKLAKSGFKDIEHWSQDGASRHGHNFKNGHGQRSAYAIGKTYKEDVAEFYRLCRNFLTHYDWTKMKLFDCKWEHAKEMWELWSDGKNGREICAIFKRRLGWQKTWYDVRLQQMTEVCIRWNKESPEGGLWESDF